MLEPSDEELHEIEEQEEAAGLLDLEDLFQDAMQERKAAKSRSRFKDPAEKPASEGERFHRLYLFPDQWTRSRAVALVDRDSQTILGTFSEYLHKHSTAKRYVREHQPMEVDGAIEVDGYIGAEQEARVRNISWDKEFLFRCGLVLDELQVEAPDVPVKIFTRFNATVRVELMEDTQFACWSGNVLLQLPAGTNVLPACSTDTKIELRKGVVE